MISFFSGCTEFVSREGCRGGKVISGLDVFHLLPPKQMASYSFTHKSLSQNENMSQSPEGNGLEVLRGFFHMLLVSSGRRRINFCPHAFNCSIEYKCPEIISKADTKKIFSYPAPTQDSSLPVIEMWISLGWTPFF